MTEQDVVKTALLEVVRKITIESGDILIVRLFIPDEDILDQLSDVLHDCNPDKKFTLIDESQIEIVRDLDEDEMRELGWVRAVSLTPPSIYPMLSKDEVEALSRGERVVIHPPKLSDKIENVIYEPPLDEKE